MHKEPKEYFLGNVDDQIFELEAELDDLETRMEDEGWEPDIDYRKQIDSLRLRLKSLKENVDDYEMSSRNILKGLWMESRKKPKELSTLWIRSCWSKRPKNHA